VKPWVGAAVAAAAILAAPGVALAGEDDPALIQYKLPSKDAIHEFESLGLSPNPPIRVAGVVGSAWRRRVMAVIRLG
jgi:hypothetical protein